MSKRVLYVGGLAEATSDHQLRDLFGAYGTVARAVIVRHKYSGKSAG
ncbi:MAG: RNA-binding protein [Nitrospira sp.]|nr:RNA-binding protein [Nitrospira sp.]